MSFKVDLLHQTIPQLSSAIQAKQLTCVELTKASLAQIGKHDHQGLTLNAILEVSTKALDEAKVLDEELKAGKSRGALHGIGFIVNDDIAVKGLGWRAGNVAFSSAPATQESPVISKLREAGAIVIGKGNLSDMWRYAAEASGWSSYGGQTLCPYNKTANPSGSSTGPAVAVACGYVPFGVGTQVVGGGIRPASRLGIVGLKPTVGLLSNDGCMAALDKFFGLSFYTKNAEEMEIVWSTISPKPQKVAPKALEDLRIGFPGEISFEGACRMSYRNAPTPAGWAPAKGGPQESQAAKEGITDFLNILSKKTCGLVKLTTIPDFDKVFKDIDGKEFSSPFMIQMASMTLVKLDQFLKDADNCPANSTEELAKYLLDNPQLGHISTYPKDYRQTVLQVTKSIALPLDSKECIALDRELSSLVKDPIDAHFRDNNLDAMLCCTHSVVSGVADFGGRPVASMPLTTVMEHNLPEGLAVIGKPGREDELLSIMRTLEPLLPGYTPPKAVVEGKW